MTESDVDNCSLCLGPLVRPAQLKCTHQFCTDCITENIAIAHSNKCPLCRGEFCSKIENTLPESTTDLIRDLEEELDTVSQDLELLQLDSCILHGHILKLQKENQRLLDAQLKEPTAWKWVKDRRNFSVCGNCHNKCTNKQRRGNCGHCEQIKYCSVSCQKNHWNKVHKYQCKEFKQRAADAPRVSVEQRAMAEQVLDYYLIDDLIEDSIDDVIEDLD